MSLQLPRAYGIDFGTSNSSVAVLRDGTPEALKIGRFGGATIPTILYFPPHSRRFLIGDEAIAAYTANGMQGRLLQSIKSLLTLSGTKFGDLGEELIGDFLRELKARADQLTGADVKSAVVGRPVAFSQNPEEDRLAEEKLKSAVRRAGFTKCRFMYEPVAALKSFQLSSGKNEVILVADLGGGTSDFTLTRFDGAGSQKILGTSGVYTAGDEIDSGVMRRRLAPFFGAGSSFRWNGQNLPFPQYLVQMLGTWYLLPKLVKEKVFQMPLPEFLQHIKPLSDNSNAIENFRKMLQHNLSYALFAAIEEAKKGFSLRENETIFFSEAGLKVSERLSRNEFDKLVQPEIDRIWGGVDEILEKTGVKSDQVSQVILTGGTSFLPVIYERFTAHFGAERVVRRNAFLSIVEGLALATAEG